MNIHLTAELERLVLSKVETGRYNSASEVVREALRLMEQRDEINSIRKEEIRKKISKGLESLKLGKGIDGEAVFERIEAELEALDHNGRK